MQPSIRKKEDCDAFTSNHGETVYELIGHVGGGSQTYSLAHVEILPKQASLKHIHPIIEESYYILHGKARMIVNDQEIFLTRGESICIPPKTPHQIFNIGTENLSFLATCVPAWTPDCLVLVE